MACSARCTRAGSRSGCRRSLCTSGSRAGPRHTVRQLARGTMEELRSLIFELRPADVASDGLVETMRKHVDVLRRVYEVEIELELDDAWPPSPLAEREVVLEREIFRIVQEAI